MYWKLSTEQKKKLSKILLLAIKLNEIDGYFVFIDFQGHTKEIILDICFENITNHVYQNEAQYSKSHTDATVFDKNTSEMITELKKNIRKPKKP